MISRVLLLLLILTSTGSAQTGHGVALEKFTGSWCGWCPYGAWVLDEIEERLGTQAVILAWHFDDKLEVRAHDTLSQAISDGGHPVLSVDRRAVIPNTQLEFSESHPWYTEAVRRLAVDPAARLLVEALGFDPATRRINFLAQMMPIVSEWPGTGKPKLAVILTEDGVVLDQSLYDTDGSPLPVLKDFAHKNVVRQVAGKVLGDSTQYAWSAGWYFQHYDFSVDAKLDLAKTRLNVLFLVENEDGSTRAVGAYRSRYLSELATMNVDRDVTSEVRIYPNPVADVLRVDIGKSARGTIEIYNALGQLQLDRTFSGSWLELDVSALAPGAYTAKVVADQILMISFIVR